MVEEMLLSYKQDAIQELSNIRIPEVKVLLFRLLNKIVQFTQKP